MTLQEWLACANERANRTRGALKQLEHQTRLSYTTLMAAKNGAAVSYETARRISEATGGEVTIEELCDPPQDDTRQAHAG